MFLYGGCLSAAASITAAVFRLPEALWISLMLCVGFGVNALIVTPIINHHRDAALAGDNRAKILFRNYHFLSVFIFVTQLFSSVYVIFTHTLWS